MIPIKRLGLFALVLPFSKLAPAHAAVPSVGVLRARDLRCDQAQVMVEREGHVHLTTTVDAVDDLYVFDPDACGSARAERAYIATSDSPACLVGFRCDSN